MQPMPCGTTLIVSPQSIAQQWLEEIEKHTEPGSLKVMVSITACMVKGCRKVIGKGRQHYDRVNRIDNWHIKQYVI